MEQVVCTHSMHPVHDPMFVVVTINDVLLILRNPTDQLLLLLFYPGRISEKNSRWPKNKNRCWYRIELPPVAASKNVVWRLWSVRSIVIASVKTGNVRIINSKAVTAIDTNRGIRSKGEEWKLLH